MVFISLFYFFEAHVLEATAAHVDGGVAINVELSTLCGKSICDF